MSQAVRKFLSNEERASLFVVGGTTGTVVAAFVVAVIAMAVMR